MKKADSNMNLNDRCVAYDRMARVLEYMGDSWLDRPDLETLAARFGLSPFHFQREFTRWAGITPKQFQSAFAHSHAGELLRDGASVLEASFEVNASGPSRLHDLFIAHEALTPGEAGSGGKHVTLTIGKGPTPFGTGVLLFSDRGLVALGFIDEGEQLPEKSGQKTGRSEDLAFADLAGRYPSAVIRRDDTAAARYAEKVFEPGASVPVALYGTPFRRQVWRALLDIPVGETLTYGGLAKGMGRPEAARATGSAVGANPVSWFIPCHRALASDGRLHNYHWGVRRKRAMLAMEAEYRGSISALT
jgi:AraC family transcriptional regulator, regulatory protein of adaptative response / methylated-DNA-[protein]-cysteine methyltransferase